MIVNLNLKGKKVLVVGGGNESLKRVNSLMKQDCKILVISNTINKSISNLVKKKKIEFRKQKIENTNFLTLEKPSIVITTTNNKELNQKIIQKAKKSKIIAYSSDNPESSDFSNPAIIDFDNAIQIAIFTGGKSPGMAKKIKEKVEKACKKTITKEDISQIKIQQIARRLAKNKIDTQIQRKAFLNSVMEDAEIKQLIKDRQTRKAEKHIITILRDWK